MKLIIRIETRYDSGWKEISKCETTLEMPDNTLDKFREASVIGVCDSMTSQVVAGYKKQLAEDNRPEESKAE